MSRRPNITVLMYHALVEQPTTGTHPIHIEVEQFAQHLAWLHAHGYEAITVTELYERLASRPPAAGKAVVITFDDGYLSLLQWAAPLLARYGFAATLFLTTDFVGQADYSAAADFAQTAPPGDRPLTWAEVRELRDAGWAIEAHSRTHRPHATLSAPELRQELEQSKQLIDSHLGGDARFYAFPYGNYNRRTLRALGAAGYLAGFSVHSGQVSPRSDLRRLPRLEMNTRCELSTFAELMRTGYASPAEKYRAGLRDALFHYPIVKDGLQKALAVFGK